MTAGATSSTISSLGCVERPPQPLCLGASIHALFTFLSAVRARISPTPDPGSTVRDESCPREEAETSPSACGSESEAAAGLAAVTQRGRVGGRTDRRTDWCLRPHQQNAGWLCSSPSTEPRAAQRRASCGVWAARFRGIPGLPASPLKLN